MIEEGMIILFNFPQTNQETTKLRPALVIRKLPGFFDDWLICMISSQISHAIPEFDEIIEQNDEDFEVSGLKSTSVIRIGRLAVVNKNIIIGCIGNINSDRLERIRKNLAHWLILSN